MTKLQRLFLEDLRAHCAIHTDELYRPAAGLGRTVVSCVMRGWVARTYFHEGSAIARGYRITKAGLRALEHERPRPG